MGFFKWGFEAQDMKHIVKHMQHKDYILEFCVSHADGCSFKTKKIYGRAWKELFPFSQHD